MDYNPVLRPFYPHIAVSKTPKTGTLYMDRQFIPFSHIKRRDANPRACYASNVTSNAPSANDSVIPAAVTDRFVSSAPEPSILPAVEASYSAK